MASKQAEQVVPIASLSRRYLFKILATVAAALTGIGVDMVASRALGPANYGNFNFLQQFFLQIFAFLSSSTSLAFVTRASRRGTSGFNILYLMSLAVMPVPLLAFVYFAFVSGASTQLWPGISIVFVSLAAAASYLVFLAKEGTSIGDAYGLTVSMEKIRVAQRVLSFLVILGIALIGHINLTTLFVYTGVVNAALAFALFLELRQRGRLGLPRRPFETRRLAATAGYFYNYSSPLITLALVIMLGGLFDRWLLQRVAGSVDQGYFSLAYQISQMVLMFITAFMPLLMREFAVAYGAGDRQRLSSLFVRVLQNLYFIAAVWACFVAVFCDKVASLVGGQRFIASAVSVAFVVLCTMYRTYGQVASTLLMSIGDTRTYRNISIIVAMAGVALTWLLVGPRGWFGLGLGALGLAYKMFAIEAINGNLMVFICVRNSGSSYVTLLRQQLVTPAVLLAMAGLIRLLFSHLLPSGMQFWSAAILLAVSGIVYAAAVIGMLLWFPSLAGLREREFLDRFARLQARLFRRT
jgi:O-antigen/teichoic acid export membrane protein